MFLTARQLEQVLRERGAALLAPGTRLTPAAQDLLRARKLTITYEFESVTAAKPQAASAVGVSIASKFAWWCGTKSGSAKAALLSASRELDLQELTILEDNTKVIAAVRALATGVKAKQVSGGVIVVDHAALACVLANRSPHLRAIVATSLACVDAGCREASANVLVIEPAAQSLIQLKNLIVRFVKASRSIDGSLQQELTALAAG